MMEFPFRIRPMPDFDRPLMRDWQYRFSQPQKRANDAGKARLRAEAAS